MFTQVIYNEIFKYGKKFIDDGLIGDILRIKNCHATKDLDHTVANKNFWNPMVSGGGALADIGPHAYSVQKYWIGEKYRLKSVKDNGITTRVTKREIQGEMSNVKVEDIALVELEWESNGKVIKGEIEAYWGENPYKFGLYHEIEGTKGIMKFPNGTLGLLLGKKPYFGIHVFFTVQSKETGKITKYSMVQPANHSESLIAIDEFCSGIPSRNPIEFAEDMMLMIDGGYISKNQGGKIVTVKDIIKYCEENAKGNSIKEQADAIIQTLF
jgi:predicted dehydrogenase